MLLTDYINQHHNGNKAERVINGEKLYATANPKHAYYCVDTRGCIGNTIDPLVRINPSEKLNKPRTVWIEQKWYEDIPEQGVLCWTNDRKEDICLIVGYHEGSSTCRFSANIISYKLPIPLTPEEIKAFLPAEPVTKYDESNWAENPSIEFPVTCHVSRNPFSRISTHKKAPS